MAHDLVFVVHDFADNKHDLVCFVDELADGVDDLVYFIRKAVNVMNDLENFVCNLADNVCKTKNLKNPLFYAKTGLKAVGGVNAAYFL